MVKEIPKRGREFGKRAAKLSHPLVSKVLSKISEIEEKEEKENPQAKTSSEAQPEIPKKPKGSLKKKINFTVRIFSILIVLSFCGWYLVSKSGPFKTWLVDRFSILTHKIIRKKDTVWIRRKIPGELRKKDFSSLKGKIRKDVKGIPVYIGVSEVKISGQDNVSTLNFTTSDPMSRVVIFYKREMGSRGYRLVGDDYWRGSNIAQLLFSREGKECTVSLVENERGGVSVAVSYTE
ncbi:MAG: hypothetical protein ACE5IT_01800 [bacterium]